MTALQVSAQKQLRQLVGNTFDVAEVRAAAQQMRTLAQPLANVRGSVAYKREMAVEFAARALLAAWRRALPFLQK